MLQIVIDLVGVCIGFLSIILIGRQLKKTGGQVHRTLVFFCLGVAFQTLALFSTLIFHRLQLFHLPGEFDLHHALMIIGLVIFVGTAYNLLPFLRTPKS